MICGRGLIDCLLEDTEAAREQVFNPLSTFVVHSTNLRLARWF